MVCSLFEVVGGEAEGQDGNQGANVDRRRKVLYVEALVPHALAKGKARISR
jgi:hypothetical protein